MDKSYIIAFLSLIIYTPFVFLGFYMMMAFLSMFEKGKIGIFINYIADLFMNLIISPLKYIFKFIVKILPFNVYPKDSDEGKKWIWHKVNLTQTLFLMVTLGLLGIALYFIMKPYKLPVFFNKYFKTSITVTTLVYFSLFVLFYILFSNPELKGKRGMGAQSELPYKYDASQRTQLKWLFGRGKDYTYNIIFTSLLITSLGIFTIYLSNHPEYLTNISLLVKIFSGVTLMFILYNTLKEIPFIKNLLKKDIFNILYQFIFIIPCLFYILVDYLYIQTRLTPQYVYYILLVQIIIVCLYIVKPLITNLIYTKTYSGVQKGIMSNEIEANEQSIDKLKNKIYEIESYRPKSLDGDKTYPALPSYEWDNMIKYGIGGTLTKDDNYVFSILKRYGYKSMDTYDSSCAINPMGSPDCAATNGMIVHIYAHIHDIITYKAEIKSFEKDNKKLKKSEKKMSNITDGIELLKNPIYLNLENTIASSKIIDKLNEGKPNLLYNYCISCWLFIHERGNNFGAQYKQFTKVLNFKNRPRISVNVHKKKLKVIMENKNGQDIEVVVDNFDLQKWNNVVVNYDGGILDIYMNGVLVSSTNNVLPEIHKHANIIVGQDDGISGGICNVLYFPTTLSHNRIQSNYKLLENRSPPIV